MNKLAVIVPLLIIASCRPFNVAFDKKSWNEKDDWDYPKREAMLDDLLKNHQIKGLTYRQIVDSLGEPANIQENNAMAYEIVTDFGSDIDPVHTKTLFIYLNKDSIATNFKVTEWNKD